MSVLMAKSILTTVVLLMAIAQAASVPQVARFLKLLPFPRQRLRAWHRRGGDATLILTVAIAVICVIHAPFRIYPLRVPLHAALGTLAAMVMLLKAIIARRFRHYLKYAWILGAMAGLSILGCFVASALWYFGSLLQPPATPPIEVTPTQAATPSPRGAEVTPVETPSPAPPRREITPTEAQSPAPQPTLTGEELVQERCTVCHGLERLDHPHTRAQWEGVVELMRSYGAELTDQEAQTLVEYLVENYGR